MLIRKPPDIRTSEITDEHLCFSRREFITAASAAAVGVVAGGAGASPAAAPPEAQELLRDVKPSPIRTDEAPNSFEHITNYNNYYEFGFDKDDPARNAARLKTSPWTIRVEGLMNAREADYHLEDILKPHPLEERVYRLRCVEAWSMVVPWIGFPLADLIKRFEPTSEARFVAFQTIYRSAEMPGLKRPFGGSAPELRTPNRSTQTPGETEQPILPFLTFPYLEGLRMDEAMHPLTMLVVGLYGRTLLNQNGAPIRLVVPWKYGFKSIKSIVKIRFVKNQPRTAWNFASPREFGFYANVNPDVNRPINQKTERRIGKFFRQPTLMFNGYADDVAHLYSTMDLRKDY